MAAADEKWRHSDPVQEENRQEEEEEEEEEEALSLCDLPVNLINEDQQQSCKKEAKTTGNNEEDFDFVPCGDGRFSTGSEMCAADDIFFRGQILPGRFSVGSETSVNMFSRHESLNPGRSISRSESMDHLSLGWSTSFSSRSSSSGRSPQSSSSTSNSSVATSARIPKPRTTTPNQFLSPKSPRPQITPSSARNPACNNGTRKSSIWDMLKRGLVRTPAIELQDLKVRNSVSRNSSSSSSSSSSTSNSLIQNFSQLNNSGGGSVRNGSGGSRSNKSCKNRHAKNVENQRKQRGLLSGCSCSVSAVKPVSLNTLVVKSSSGSSTVNDFNNDKIRRESTEEKLKEAKMKKKMEQTHHQGKQAMSSHRTFEWIKQL